MTSPDETARKATAFDRIAKLRKGIEIARANHDAAKETAKEAKAHVAKLESELGDYIGRAERGEEKELWEDEDDGA